MLIFWIASGCRPYNDGKIEILLFAKAKSSKNFYKDSHFVRILFFYASYALHSGASYSFGLFAKYSNGLNLSLYPNER